MTGPAVAMMIVICALVWGGFVSFLCIIWNIEKKKRAANEPKPDRNA